MSKTIFISIALVILGTVLTVGCRSRLGGKCASNDDCALGLYCNLDKEICDDRGKLLKRKAEETYVYPIPAKAPGVPLPVVPVAR